MQLELTTNQPGRRRVARAALIVAAWSAMLGLGDDAGASFEFASAAQLCAELAILGPWNLVAADNWPPDLMERGAQLFSCEWHNGGKPDGL